LFLLVPGPGPGPSRFFFLFLILVLVRGLRDLDLDLDLLYLYVVLICFQLVEDERIHDLGDFTHLHREALIEIEPVEPHLGHLHFDFFPRGEPLPWGEPLPPVEPPPRVEVEPKEKDFLCLAALAFRLLRGLPSFKLDFLRGLFIDVPPRGLFMDFPPRGLRGSISI